MFLDAFKRHRFVLFGGAAGPGKSYILRWWLVSFLVDCYQRLGLSNVHVGLFCEDYPSLFDRQISKIEVEFPSWLGHLRRSGTREFVLNPEYGGGVLALRNLDDVSKYLSAEFAAIGVDELTRNELPIFNFLRMRMRWTGIEKPLFGAATNPGGKGHAWVKNFWLDGKFPVELQHISKEFKYIPAKPQENPHLSEQYYADLATLPDKMQQAYLKSNWNILSGQYFTLDEAVGGKHIYEDMELKDWWPRWIGADWGFDHPASIHWFARRDDGHIVCYRELYGSGIEEPELGRRIAQASEGETITAFYLGGDAFAKRGVSRTVAQQIGDVVKGYGIPEPTQADDDRIGGARLVAQLLNAGMVHINQNCVHLTDCIPALIHDEDNREDVLKFDASPGQAGDDAYDSFRYGLKSYLSPGRKPFEIRVTEKVAQFAESKGVAVEDMDVNSVACLTRRARFIENKHRRRRGGLGRIWRPQNQGA